MFLAYLAATGSSPNTVQSYAYDLRDFFVWLKQDPTTPRPVRWAGEPRDRWPLSIGLESGNGSLPRAMVGADHACLGCAHDTLRGLRGIDHRRRPRHR
ncbi:site-specific integrase [Streptomyces beigongshangae]|uniref:site-specific integrase n=1 Tax=Streptomyces beigongshangae TaxID=2841597 RepID=UPI0027E20034|nr:site-specific integrase [Streptomyces sp. REN17]